MGVGINPGYREGDTSCAETTPRFSLLALSTIPPPLDVVVSLEMNLDLAAHAYLVAQVTVRLHHGGVEVPVRADFHFF